MGKTADLTMVQKTIIDTLHKEGKSQKVITERGGWSRSAVSKHIKCKLTGMKKLGMEMYVHKQHDEHKLENTVKQADSNTWESFTRSELKLESVHQSHHAQTLQEKATKSLLKQKHHQSIWPGLRKKRTGLLLSGPKVLFSDESNVAFNLEIKVPESGGRVERHIIHVAWSPVWSIHSQWWFGLPCHLLVLVHCDFHKSTVNTAIYQDILEHFVRSNSIRAAETHLSSIFIWPSNSSTLYSNFIWSNLSSFYLKKHTHIWPSINCIFIL